MYLGYYGLREEPFGVTPDPRYLYPSPSHREALASLRHGVDSGRGFIALTADPGMGKTTLLFQLLDRTRSSSCSAFIFNTQCNSRELLHHLLTDMRIDSDGQNIVAMHEQLNQALLNIHRTGKKFLLVIDEAQNLEDEALEAVRLLSDFETPRSKLMQIVLSGQPQLAAKLVNPDLIQLRQRISMFCRLNPLTRTEIEQYINHRLAVAGYQGGRLFAPEALALIATHSKGIPRNINNLCFNALSLGCAMGRKSIDAAAMQEVVWDLDVHSLVPAVQEVDEGSVVKLSPPSQPPIEAAETGAPLSWRRYAAAFALTSVLACLISILLLTEVHGGPWLTTAVQSLQAQWAEYQPARLFKQIRQWSVTAPPEPPSHPERSGTSALRTKGRKRSTPIRNKPVPDTSMNRLEAPDSYHSTVRADMTWTRTESSSEPPELPSVAGRSPARGNLNSYSSDSSLAAKANPSLSGVAVKNFATKTLGGEDCIKPAYASTGLNHQPMPQPSWHQADPSSNASLSMPGVAEIGVPSLEAPPDIAIQPASCSETPIQYISRRPGKTQRPDTKARTEPRP